MTEPVTGVLATNTAKHALREYEVFERVRQGFTPTEIARDLGLTKEQFQQMLRAAVNAAREYTKEYGQIALANVTARYHAIYSLAETIATDDSKDTDVRLKAANVMLAANVKMADLYQLGRAGVFPATKFVQGESLTEAEAKDQLTRLGIKLPKLMIDSSGNPDVVETEVRVLDLTK